MPGEPCVLCGHAPHANSSPNNPGGCSVITNDFRQMTCNCPEYRSPGRVPQRPKRYITLETWPACSMGVQPHYIDTIDEEDDGAGNTVITARCCGRTDTLVVPQGAKLVRGLLGLRVVGGVATTPSEKKPYPVQGPFASAKAEAPSVAKQPDKVAGGLLEID